MTIEAGEIIEGFRIEAVLGRGTQGVVYEATQLALGRRVALKILGDEISNDPAATARFRREIGPWASLHHPRLVAVYDIAESVHGLFIAMQLVRGSTLEALVEESALEASHALRVLGQVAEALDAAHAAGLVHGDITCRNVLVDGVEHALLAKSGLSGQAEEATQADDRVAFDAMMLECLAGEPNAPALRRALSDASSDHHSAVALVGEVADALAGVANEKMRGRKRLYVTLGAFVATAAVLASILTMTGDSAPATERQPAPAVLAGAVALGSELAPGATRPLGCDGLPQTPNSPGCTILQTSLSGRSLAVAGDGVIRSWAVRGVRGQLRIQVIRPIADGRFIRVFSSQIAEVPDEGVHSFAAELEVKRGDLLGVALSPGAGIGVRTGRRAATVRWFGPLSYEARTPNLGEATGFDHEILLRADVVSGALRRLPAQLTGSQAAAAPTGSALSSRQIELEGGVVVRVVLVKLPDRIVLDMFRGTKRMSRIDIPDVDPAGSLVEFLHPDAATTQTDRVPVANIRLTWTNPGARIPLEHRWALTPQAIQFLD